MLMKKKRFWLFTLGIICLGLGQRLSRLGFLQPWAEDRSLLIVIGVLGLILFAIGSAFLLKVLIWLFRHFNQNNQLIKVMLLATGAVILSGFVIGSLGQILYDNTSLDYGFVKDGIWLVTCLAQALIKSTVIFVVSCFLTNRPFTFKNKKYHNLLMLVGLLTLSATLIGLLVPIVSESLLFIVDTALVVGITYYLIEI